jgi:hypothetical protein
MLTFSGGEWCRRGFVYVDMSNTAINRQQEGLAIANFSGAIKRINEMEYSVKSQNGNGDYDVLFDRFRLGLLMFSPQTSWCEM